MEINANLPDSLHKKRGEEMKEQLQNLPNLGISECNVMAMVQQHLQALICSTVKDSYTLIIDLKSSGNQQILCS